MSAPVISRISLEQFLAWEECQETRHEFVGGEIRAMVGGTVRHNRIGLNVTFALRTRLRGKPCEAFGSDMKVRTPTGNIRYPDSLVDCGKPAADSQEAAEPRVIVEVLSPSTEWFDQTRKLEDYQSIASVTHVAYIAQDRALVRVWTRGVTGWLMAELSGRDSVLDISILALTIPLSEIYEGVEF